MEIFEQHELVDLPPARTSSSDAVSIGLPRRPTVQVRSEARNHHPCPLCPSVRPRRPALALHDRARRGPCALPTLQTRPRAPHVHPLGILPHIPACLQEFFSLTLSLPLPLSQVLSAPSCAGPPPAKISRLGGVLTHRGPKRAPGAEFCASLHGALGVVHACRACCSCLVQKSGPMSVTEPALPVRCGCMLSSHIRELVHDITSIPHVN